jgi:hypothetical protein
MRWPVPDTSLPVHSPDAPPQVRSLLKANVLSVLSRPLAAVMMPLDTIKTRLQFQGNLTSVRRCFFFFFVLFYCVETGLLEARYRSFVDAFCAILKEEGPAGFFRGLSAKLLYKVHNQVLKSSCSAAGIWVPFSDPAARHQQAPSVLDAMNC